MFADFAKFFVHVASSHRSVLLSRRYGTLCTSGFVDDAIVATSLQCRARVNAPLRPILDDGRRQD